MFENLAFGSSRGIKGALCAVAAAMLQESDATLWDGGKPVVEPSWKPKPVVLPQLLSNPELASTIS